MSKQFITLPFGQTINISYKTDRFISEVLTGKEYEYGIPDKNDLVICDIGCNIGCFSFSIYDKAKDIYALDISQSCLDDLIETIRENSLNKIHPFHIGIGTDNTSMPVLSNGLESEFGGWHINNQENGSNEITKEDVEVLTLYTFLSTYGIPHVDIVKLDIEGMENAIVDTDDFPYACERIDSFIGEYHGVVPLHMSEVFQNNGYTFTTYKGNHFLAKKL